MKIEESNLTFEFPKENKTIKFDDDKYYRKHFVKMPHAKGVDFISFSSERLLFLEVKNCRGHESDNVWRIYTNNRKLNTMTISQYTEGRESLDIEVAQKVAMSISAIVGAASFGERRETGTELLSLMKEISSNKFSLNRKEWIVILFLEGNFRSVTRTKKMIMQDLQNSIRQKLDWLNCKVSVVDSDTYRNKYFNVV